MWKKSQCKRSGFLHNFRHYRTDGMWEVEICTRCHQQLVIRTDITNNILYLSHHLRETLPKHHPRFRKEYAGRLDDYGFIQKRG